ncbi:MAG: hypothetical protein V3V95_00515 [Thermodesulfobacteriota bacterium]
MSDLSHLDDKYFIDEYVYNCPYCNRNNVPYEVEGSFQFDWNKEKECYGYLVKCRSCHNSSMHLSFTEIELYRGYDNNRFNLGDAKDKDIDSLFFYSVPSSNFILDERIPAVIRDLIVEADGCVKMNYLSGASACMRKAVHELLIFEKAEGAGYSERIGFLKKKYTGIDSIHFEILERIDDMGTDMGTVNDKAHEQTWETWEPKYINLLIETLRAVLNEVFIIPSLKKEKKKEIEALLEDIKKDGEELVDLELKTFKK